MLHVLRGTYRILGHESVLHNSKNVFMIPLPWSSPGPAFPVLFHCSLFWNLSDIGVGIIPSMYRSKDHRKATICKPTDNASWLTVSWYQAEPMVRAWARRCDTEVTIS